MLFGGGHIYSSDNPIEGYKPDPKNAAFHVDGDGVAFTRLWNVQGSGNEEIVLISHQWMYVATRPPPPSTSLFIDSI